jgi:FG-GAP-like repeat
MSLLPGAHRAFRFVRLASVVALVGAAACSQHPAAQTSASSAADRAEVAAPATAAPAPAEPATSEESEVFTDELGRYTLLRIPKVEGQYLRLDDGMVAIRWGFGFNFHVAREDDEAFWVKIYQPEEQSTPPSAPAPPSAPEPAVRVAAASGRLKFVDFGRGLPSSGQWMNGFALADVNGDGHPDIVHGPSRKGAPQPQIFLGDGAGNWRRWDGLQFDAPRMDYGDLAVADFDGDGKLDLALAMHLRGLLVLVDRGEGHFVSWSKGLDYGAPEAGGPSAFSSRALVAVDWNHDGRPDLLALGEGPRLARKTPESPAMVEGSRGPVVYLNRGDGTWERHDQGTGRERPFGDGLATADFDGDGRPDFVTCSNAVGLRDIVYFGEEGGGWRSEPLGLLPAGVLVWAVTAADFNHDGRGDIALGILAPDHGDKTGWTTQVEVLLSRGKAGWDRRVLAVEPGRAGVRSLAAGDLDGDGRLDLVAGTGDGDLWVFVGDGAGGFTRDSAAGLDPTGSGCGAYGIRLADLDGQPGDELVAAFAGEPGSEVMLGMTALCPSGGALRAWKVQRR